MMSQWSDNMHRIKAELITAYGGKCMIEGCTEQDPDVLQFAHLKPTKLSGSGRGMGRRLYDVKNNFQSYCLICPWEHYLFDSGEIVVQAHGKEWKQ